jgi:hypothetical protein
LHVLSLRSHRDSTVYQELSVRWIDSRETEVSSSDALD